MDIEKKLKSVFGRYRELYPAKNRIEFYKKSAEKLLIKEGYPEKWGDLSETQKDEILNPSKSELKIVNSLYFLIIFADESLKALADNDIDLYTQNFERVIQYQHKANLPPFKGDTAKIKSSRGGKNKKGCEGPLKQKVRYIFNTFSLTTAPQVITALENLADNPDEEVICSVKNNTIEYWQNGKIKKVSYSRITNILSDIKKEEK